ncbi:MAG TPA: DUF1731 domain-containing protein [Acidimicrobiales bacterium]|nr:DUF1731 domain-containing protein [Acidimicrobiales bacterium]
MAGTLAALDPRPRVLVSGSAVGYYGIRGDEVLTEESSRGRGFLADVADQWEAAAAPATRAGIRTVSLRTGIVLSARGGALAPLLRLFRLGLGGRLGPGTRWWSWIALADEVGVIRHALTHDSVRGPVNATRGLTEEVALAGQRALPTVAETTGYRFRHPDLRDALRAVLAPS